jgi:hypothetical protein
LDLILVLDLLAIRKALEHPCSNTLMKHKAVAL